MKLAWFSTYTSILDGVEDKKEEAKGESNGDTKEDTEIPKDDSDKISEKLGELTVTASGDGAACNTAEKDDTDSEHKPDDAVTKD